MNKIKELRIKAGMKQSELSSLLGIAQNTLSYWEQNKYQPDNDTLLKLADIFNVTIDYLLGRSTSSTASGSPSPEGKATIQQNENPLTGKELALITAYRSNPAMQGAVDKLLGVPTEPINNITDDVVSELRTPLFVRK